MCWYGLRGCAFDSVGAAIRSAQGPGDRARTRVRERGQIEAHIRKSLVTVHHPCGTCRLGDVVDTSLRVKGAGALRVVDASVIPTVISGNSNIPVNAVAERAADLILEKIR